jgi:hypothetical protein
MFLKFLKLATTERKTCQNLAMDNKGRVHISAPER